MWTRKFIIYISKKKFYFSLTKDIAEIKKFFCPRHNIK